MFGKCDLKSRGDSWAFWPTISPEMGFMIICEVNHKQNLIKYGKVIVSTMSLKYIDDSPSHYWKSYTAMRDNFYMCPYVYDIGDKEFQEKILEVLPQQESLKVLGIGSGQGELDCINMRRMLTRVSHIENTVVEPSMEPLEVYRSLSLRDLSNRVTTSWHQETLQQYQKRRECINVMDKFHFISAIHSLYSTDKDSIGCLIDLLEDDGVLLIAIQNDNSGYVKFSTKVAEKYGTRYTRVTTGYMTSLVSRVLDDDERVTYEVIENRHNVDVTPCFEEGSLKGSLVLDFLTHVVDFKSTISKDVLQSVLDYLKTPDCSEILSNGKIIFHEDWDAFIIRKK